MSTLAIIGLGALGWIFFIALCCALGKAAAVGDEVLASIERERLIERDEL